MIIKQVVGHVNIDSPTRKKREWLELEWEELNRRILRKITDSGRELRISLEHGEPLNTGDVIYEDEQVEIVVRTTLEEVYVIYPASMTEMGKIAFELGNRHTPCLIEQKEIIVRYDETLQPLLREAGVHFEKTTRRFGKPFKYRGHRHDQLSTFTSDANP